MTSFPLRMLRAALLHADTYEEVEADRSSIGQAFLVVLAASAAFGLARWIEMAAVEIEPARKAFQLGLATVEPLVVWVGGSAFVFMVGATFFRGPETETDFAEVLRTTGFAFTPGLLGALAFVPPPALGLAIEWLARLWVMICVVVAIRQALDFTTPRAVGTFGGAALLLWLILWGASVAPLPF